MKRYIILFVCGLLFIWACSEDFLDRYPLDQISPQSYFKTPNDLKLYANRFYPQLSTYLSWSGGIFWYDNNSDNMASLGGQSGTLNTCLAGTRTIPSSGGGWNWSDIRQANYFLNNWSTAEGSQEDINQYVGEVKFFRAFLYFDKVKTFGDVPWINTPLNTNSPELYNPRDSRKLVVDSIVADLDYAIANLKAKGDADAFRINKEIALLFKARVCLYEGTWEKYHNGTSFGVENSDGTAYLQKAADAANQLIEMNSYSIYQGSSVGKEYWSLFNQTDYSNNPEVMLWRKYSVAMGVTNNIDLYLAFGEGNIGVSKSLIDSYLCIDGSPISVSPLFMGYDSIAAEVLNRDPRLAQTIFLRGYDITVNSPGGSADLNFTLPPIDEAGEKHAPTGYVLYKGGTPEYSMQYADNIGILAGIIFRYAEALLTYAEAKAELGTITQGDIDKTVNVLRDRVGMVHLNISSIVADLNWDFPTLSPIINEIRRERRVELACEGYRWDDLARWRADNLIAGKHLLGAKYVGSNLEGAYKDGNGNDKITIGVNLWVDENGFIDVYQNVLPNGFGFSPERDYLSPIPSDELVLNQNLVQNPGW